jgi:hypothetical protein
VSETAVNKSLNDLSATEVIDLLGLEYLDGEGVWIKLLWRTPEANAIYGLLTDTDFSALHQLHEIESWVHVAGAPIDMTILHSDHSVTHQVIGQEVGSGQEPQFLVPKDAWQGSTSRGKWSLVVCMLAPPFSGFELARSENDFTPWLNSRNDDKDRIGLVNRLKELIREGKNERK